MKPDISNVLVMQKHFNMIVNYVTLQKINDYFFDFNTNKKLASLYFYEPTLFDTDFFL